MADDPIAEYPAATTAAVTADLHAEADRARQDAEFVYGQAITDPASSHRYQTDLAFRLDIDLRRYILRDLDRALDREDIPRETRDRIIFRMLSRNEPLPCPTIDLGSGAPPINLPHGPFGIRAERTSGSPFFTEVTVDCSCGRFQKWERSVPGGHILAWLRDHPTWANRDPNEQITPFWTTGLPSPRRDQADG